MRISVLLLLCLVLVSCRSHQPPEPDLPDLAQIELAEAAIAVDKSLDNLQAISAERAVLVMAPQTADQLDYGMHQLASVDWAGPGQPLIQRLAVAAGYRMRVLGKAPVHTSIVALDKREVAIGELLRDVALQMQRNADIVVFPRAKLIEVRYF